MKWGGLLVSGDDVGKLVVDRSRRLRRELARAFGEDILRGERLRRSLLAQRAFAGPSESATLNQIVHPPLLRELNRQIHRARRSTGRVAVVVDAALLAEWGPERVYWDALIGVWAPFALRRRRLRRSGWSDRQISGRARSQMSWTARRAMLNYVVKNDADLSQLERRARLCWQKVLSFTCR